MDVEEIKKSELPEVDETQEAAPEELKGRALLAKRYREANADADEPDDDVLSEYAMGQIDDYKGKYDNLNSINARFVEKLKADPRLSAFINLIVGENKSPEYSFAKIYGKDVLDFDDDGLANMDEGYEEYLKSVEEQKGMQSKRDENIAEFDTNFNQYVTENKLPEERVSELSDKIMELGDNFLMGKITPDLIAFVDGGITREADIEDAAVTGKIEGRNEKIRAEMKKDAGAGFPTTGGESTASESAQAMQRAERPRDFFEANKFPRR